MKTSIIIRFVLSAVFATVSCVGVITGNEFFMFSWCIAGLLLTGRSELVKPMAPPSRKELLAGMMILVVFIGLVVTLNVWLPEPPLPVRAVLAAVFWLLGMWGIYCRWQKEKRKAAALLGTDTVGQDSVLSR